MTREEAVSPFQQSRHSGQGSHADFVIDLEDDDGNVIGLCCGVCDWDNYNDEEGGVVPSKKVSIAARLRNVALCMDSWSANASILRECAWEVEALERAALAAPAAAVEAAYREGWATGSEAVNLPVYRVTEMVRGVLRAWDDGCWHCATCGAHCEPGDPCRTVRRDPMLSCESIEAGLVLVFVQAHSALRAALSAVEGAAKEER